MVPNVKNVDASPFAFVCGFGGETDGGGDPLPWVTVKFTEISGKGLPY